MLNELNGCPHYEINSPLNCGGYFIWIKLSENIDVAKVKAQLEKDNIVVGWGEIFVQASDRDLPKFSHLKRRIRLGYSYLDEEVLVEGCKRVRAAIENNVIGNNAKF